MDRREFLRTMGSAVAWTSIAITAAACGEDDSTGPEPSSRNLPADISNSQGHSHSGTVSTAQIAAGGTIFLTITGAGHTHEVELSPADVDQLAQNQAVTVQSGNGGDPVHSHQVTFTP